MVCGCRRGDGERMPRQTATATPWPLHSTHTSLYKWLYTASTPNTPNRNFLRAAPTMRSVREPVRTARSAHDFPPWVSVKTRSPNNCSRRGTTVARAFFKGIWCSFCCRRGSQTPALPHICFSGVIDSSLHASGACGLRDSRSAGFARSAEDTCPKGAQGHPSPSILVAESPRPAKRVSPSTRAVRRDGRHKRMRAAVGRSAVGRSVEGDGRIKRVGVRDCTEREQSGDGGGGRGEQREGEECGGADRAVEGALERTGGVR